MIKSNEVFHHYALFYSDPGMHDEEGNSGDGYLYVVFGYTPSPPGIHNLLVRIPFNLNSSCIGRDTTKPIQIFRDDDPSGDSPYCPGPGRWEDLTKCEPNICNPLIVPSDYPGCIPMGVSEDFRSGLFNEFVPGMAVPLDWITLKDSGGNFYGSMLVYHSGTSFSTDRIALRFTRDIRPPFRFSEERELNTCFIDEAYSTCEAGNLNVGLYQPSPSQFPSFYNSDGSPAKIFGFFGFKKVTPDRPSCGHDLCSEESAGLLPAIVELTSIPYTGGTP